MATSVQGVGSELVLELHWLHARPKPVVKAVHRSLFLKVPLRVRDVYVTGPRHIRPNFDGQEFISCSLGTCKV